MISVDPLVPTGVLALTNDPVGWLPELWTGALTLTRGELAAGLVLEPVLLIGALTLTSDPVGWLLVLSMGALTLTSGDPDAAWVEGDGLLPEGDGLLLVGAEPPVLVDDPPLGWPLVPTGALTLTSDPVVGLVPEPVLLIGALTLTSDPVGWLVPELWMGALTLTSGDPDAAWVEGDGLLVGGAGLDEEEPVAAGAVAGATAVAGAVYALIGPHAAAAGTAELVGDPLAEDLNDVVARTTRANRPTTARAPMEARFMKMVILYSLRFGVLTFSVGR